MLYSVQGQLCENVYHVQMPTQPDATVMNNIIDELKTWEATYPANSRGNLTALYEIKCKDLTVADGVGVDRQIVPLITGVDTTQQLPNNVTVAIAWRTGRTGRSYRGRTFHLGLCVNQITGNTLTNPTLTGLVSAYTQLLTTFGPAGGQLVVVSLRHNNAWRAAGVATPITGCTVNGTLDSQRRRLPEHNRHR